MEGQEEVLVLRKKVGEARVLEMRELVVRKQDLKKLRQEEEVLHSVLQILRHSCE